jgi:hypothetical protein
MAPSSSARVAAAQVPSLGAASAFAAFGGSDGITNQGTNTVVHGNIGTTGASTMLTGFHSNTFVYVETPLNVGTVDGLVITDAPQGTPADFILAKAVAADALNASNLLAAIPGGIDPGAGLLGGLTLAPGVYKSANGSFLLDGSDLTLDAQGDANAIWVFQMASSLTVGNPTSARSVVLANGAQSKNVYWQVGSAATINGAGGGTMVGTIIANSGVVISTPGNMTLTTLNGRALGLFASVTMVNTVINVPDGWTTGLASTTRASDTSKVHVVVTGTHAADVAAVADTGYINIVNNGGYVSATETGAGTINVVNNGSVVTVTNTGNGTMTIHNTSTAAVTVTNTGSGNVYVTATGGDSLTLTHTGNEDFTYPATTSLAKR